MKSFIGFLKFLLLAVCVLAGFIFAARNAQPVALWLLADFAPRPLGMWLLLAFAAGALLGLLLGIGLFRKLRLTWQLRQVQGQLQRCRQELAAAQDKASAGADS